LTAGGAAGETLASATKSHAAAAKIKLRVAGKKPGTGTVDVLKNIAVAIWTGEHP
jgi:hypothetical protein